MTTIPAAIQRLDRGAELMHTYKNGDQAWSVTFAPPSGMEQDRVYIYSPSTRTARRATEQDMERI